MDDKDSDRGGFPDSLHQQMTAAHAEFMRAAQAEDRRLEAWLDQDNNTKSPSSSPAPTNSSNVFVSFKNFVDTNLNNLAESIRSLPPHMRQMMQAERESEKPEELDISRRWTGLDDTPDHVELLVDRSTPTMRSNAISAAVFLLWESRRRNVHVPPEQIEALYRDHEGGHASEADRWLSVDWFKRNPYSPIRLEAHRDFGNEGSKWRVAFEDLMNASLGKSTTSQRTSQEQCGYRPPFRQAFPTLTAPGLDWMLSLQCRGILPPQLPGLYNRPPGATSASDNLNVIFMNAKGALPDMTGVHGAPDFWKLVIEIATPPPGHTESQPETELDLYGAQSSLSMDADQKRLMLCEAQNEMDRDKLTRLETEQMDREELSQMDMENYQAELAGLRAHVEAQREVIGDEAELVWRLNRRFVDAPDDEDAKILQALYGKVFPLKDEEVEAQADGFPGNQRRQERASEQMERREQEMMERREQEIMALGLCPAAGTAERSTMQGSPPSKPNAHQPEKVDILSSLTTTHTTRLPDGTVTTKVVLRQSFADGREETEEKVHTYRQLPPGSSEAKEAEGHRPQTGKGWFWT